ncbi:conserved unknown protein [Ectocarpus siliculosus]|uniref:Uncharacterized protein n=1 Tax=Ectocarpus siliculosus TaxID=2880 RepID=D7FVQ0_ECTSI|nr:conserved unknown protein [Ectocarpus siliculosus]|eukprot:CBJ31971.1 conserved unknown protein [Ectocarpus siliculosus]
MIPRRASCSPRRISDRTPVVPRTPAPAGEEANLPELAEPIPHQSTAPGTGGQTQGRGSEPAVAHGEADAVDSGQPSSSTPQTSAGGPTAAATEASTASPLPSPLASPRATSSQPRKRGRQRPKPAPQPSSAELEAPPEINTPATPERVPPPDKTGRPRKTPLPPAAADQAANPDLRKRGRPKKTQLEPAASDESTTPDLPRKRGRPRKTPLEPAVPDEATTPDLPRKRGRPRKTPLEPAAPDEATTLDLPRKRGRPRKAPLEPAAPDEATTPDLPRKRGRPRKTPLEPAAPDEATTPDLPRKRGRPRKTPLEPAAPDKATTPDLPCKRGRPRKTPLEPAVADEATTPDQQRATPSNSAPPSPVGTPTPRQQRLPAEPREEVDIPAGRNADGSAEPGSKSGKMRRKAQLSAGQRQQQQSPEANPPPANHAQDGAGADIGRHVDDGGSVGDCGEDFGGNGGGSVDGGSCNEMNEGGSHVTREEEGRVASSEQQVDGSVKAGGVGKKKRAAVSSGALRSQSRRKARELADPPAGNERHRGIPRSTRGGGGGTSDGNKDETEGPTTTRDEDLALVREMHQESEGLLAVRKRLRREVVTLQDEEDELRLVLGLPPARSELVLPTLPPPPLPPPVEPSEAVAPAKKKRRSIPQRRTTPPEQGEPSVATGTSSCSSSSPAAANGASVSPQHPSPSVAMGASSCSPATASGAGASPPRASPSVATPSSSPAAAGSAGVARPSVSPSRTERSPVAAASSRSSSIAAASSPQALASAPGNDDTPMGSPLSLPVPGSPVGSFDLAPAENDDIEKLLLGLDSMTGDDDDDDDDDDIIAPAGGLGGLRHRGVGPAPPPPPPSFGGAPIGARQQPLARERTAGSEPQLSGRRGNGGLNQPESVAGRGTAVGNSVRGQQRPGRGKQLLSSGRGGVASGGRGRGRGARRAPNYLDLNASFLRRPAGRGAARGGRLGSGSRGGRGSGGRGPPVVGSGRGGRRNGPVGVGGGSAAARPGGGGLGSGASRRGRVGGRGHLVRGATGSPGAPGAGGVRENEPVGVAQHSVEQTSTGGARVTTVSPGDACLPGGSGRPPGL